MGIKYRCIRGSYARHVGSVLGPVALAVSISFNAHVSSAATKPPFPSIQVSGPGGQAPTIVSLVNGARLRVLVEAFDLSDPSIIAALTAAANRGVDVRAMLDPQGYSSTATAAVLQKAGSLTHAPNDQSYGSSHLNEIVIDTSAVVIADSAFVASTLATSSVLAVDTNRIDVLQSSSLFYDDWLRRSVRLYSQHLVVGPDNNPNIVSMINAAQRHIDLYAAYLTDSAIVLALNSAAARGVVVHVLVPSGTATSNLDYLSKGNRIRIFDFGPGSFIVADQTTIYIGSSDLSPTLHNIRDLGVILTSAKQATSLHSAFDSNFAKATSYHPKPKVIKSRHPLVTAVPATIQVPVVLRLGGNGLISVRTVAHASVIIVIRYAHGSRPDQQARGVSGSSGSVGHFVYKWTLNSKILPGQATATVTIRKGHALTNKTFAIPVTK